ncbi:unnamed protein product [Miscanthus lutarioriparius]|uniref:Secreted protein n=1 Tax=Miscanthus lutarioriparius TaxID=422564 RepID=A0A811PVY5_9POAL|nr:unnamed protein product [Miscanthus lutarioriparius]
MSMVLLGSATGALVRVVPAGVCDSQSTQAGPPAAYDGGAAASQPGVRATLIALRGRCGRDVRQPESAECRGAAKPAAPQPREEYILGLLRQCH